MIPAGYMSKHVAVRHEWLKDLPHVEDIYSLSHCLSAHFGDYIDHWRHNGFWLFDGPEIIHDIAAKSRIDLAATTLFYYEAYEFELNDGSTWSLGEDGTWSDIDTSDFPNNVTPPVSKELKGFDVVCHMLTVADPGCSPLSCNGIAKEVAVNRHCLFDTLDQAKAALDAGNFANTEPGSKRIFAVYAVDD